MLRKRKKPTLEERLRNCECCLHPISENHHLLDVARFGTDNNPIIHLCANCHEVYHLYETYQTVRKVPKHSEALLKRVFNDWELSEHFDRMDFIEGIFERKLRAIQDIQDARDE